MNKCLLFLIVFFCIIGQFDIQAKDLNTSLTDIIELDTTPDPSKEEVFKVVEYMPHFPGCEDEVDRDARKKCSDIKIINFINENIKYPETGRAQGIEGTAVVRFVVEKDGKLSFSEQAILRNPGAGLGEEALRVIQTMPNWIPGKADGEAVRVTFTMPIKFALGDEEDLPDTESVTIKWDGIEMAGTTKRNDPSKYVKVTCNMDIAQNILTRNVKGMPVTIKYKDDSKGFTQYYVSVGKKGKKYLIRSISKNKGFKKQMLKALKSGESIYFFNWEYKKTFLEITVE